MASVCQNMAATTVEHGAAFAQFCQKRGNLSEAPPNPGQVSSVDGADVRCRWGISSASINICGTGLGKPVTAFLSSCSI